MNSPADNPVISVVIPTYNCSQYIAQAIESVLAQTYGSYEIIVIDDGSTDDTCRVLSPYREYIRYIQQQNQGVSSARNLGIQLSRGTYIAFLDADDFFLPNKMAAQLAIFEEKPYLGIVHSGWFRIDSQGQPLMPVEPWNVVPQLSLEGWLQWKPVLPSAMMFQRQWLEKVDGFNSKFPPAEDVDLVLRLSSAGCQADWLRQITVCYRQHNESAMHKGLPQARSLSAVIDAFFQQPDLPPKIRLIEHQVRHDTLVWIGWYLYQTGHPDAMVIYLKRAWEYRSRTPAETLSLWVESFQEFSQRWGDFFDPFELGNNPEWKKFIDSLLNGSGYPRDISDA